MKRILAAAAALLVLIFSVGCVGSEDVKYVDGVYRVEFSDYKDGYKDFVEVSVEDGAVSKIIYDAISEKTGELKSEIESYNETMKSFSGTYPAKFYKDLANQYLEKHSAAEIDIVAGATTSSENFKTLMTMLETAMINGDTEVQIIEIK